MRLRRSDPTSPGLTRQRAGRGFRYLDESRERLTDEFVIARIRQLAIPPAWQDVWICPFPNGHIQATGSDASGRRQYLYHEAWRRNQDRVKFDRALDLAAALPSARRAVTRSLNAPPPVTRDRALACAFRILDTAALRIGSEQYEAEYGSHGLATLRTSQVTVKGDTVRFRFPGKSGKLWESEVSDEALASVVRAMKVGRSGTLLAWQDENGWRVLSPAEINDDIRRRTRGDFTAKDFRTLHGTIVAAQSLQRTGVAENKTARARAVAAAMREVAAELGNTSAVARKSYVDPRVIDHYAAGEVIAPTGAAETALLALLA
jgi:DNA topoisomerase-1